MTAKPPDAASATSGRPGLRRTLTLPLVVLYGMGTTVGAGIYALVGEIAGVAGVHAPLSFLVAGAIAALSGLTFAELASRFPKSAGEAVYVREGLRLRGAPLVVGSMVVLAGSVSAATITNAFVGYLGELVEWSHAFAVVVLVAALVALAIWGIAESVRVAGLVTLIEVVGLLAVSWVARDAIAPGAMLVLDAPVAWSGMLGGSLLAFYAFLGFEDMVNVAEEVRDAPRTLPRAIVVTLVLTLILYLLISTVAIGAVPPAELAASDAPLVLVWERSGAGSGVVIAWISIAAMVNGALIQIIMASRVVYGMADQGWLPRALASVGRRTKTPVLATAMIGSFVLALALLFPLGPLARVTSVVTLAIFALVNAALWRLQARSARGPNGGLPRWVPASGFATCVGLLLFESIRQLA